MAKLISVYSYRGGTGKTNCIANIAAIVACCGYRVCVVDANLQSPGIHVLFGLDACTLKHCLNDYLWVQRSLKDIVYDVTTVMPKQRRDRSQLYLVPASLKLGDQARILREGYDVSLLQHGLHRLIDALQLDYLFIDTPPGINEETLLAIDASDLVLFILSPDQQDFQGIEAAVTMAQKFAVPQLLPILNKVPVGLDANRLTAHLKTTYGITIAQVLPYSADLLHLASRGLFVFTSPSHPFTESLEAIARQIIQ